MHIIPCLGSPQWNVEPAEGVGWWQILFDGQKSCTTKDDDYPIIYKVLTIPGGAGFIHIYSIKSMSEEIFINWKGPKVPSIFRGIK